MRYWLLIFAGLISACTPTVVQPPAPTPVPAVVPTVVQPPTSTTTPIVVPSPAVVPTSISKAEPIDLSPYKAAMRADFVKDLDQFATATQYQIELTFAPDLTVYTATQHVRYTNTENTALDAIYFRLFPNTATYGGQLTLNSLKLNGGDVEPIEELGKSALRIPIEPPLPIGAVVDFDLAYVTRVPTASVTSGYNQFGLFNGVLAIPNFYPQIPVYDDEGWNVELAPGMGDAVYSDSALYQVNILAPKDQVIAASGTCEAQAAPAGQQYQHCVSGPMRDFMIAMSAKYKVSSQTVDDIKVNSYYLPKETGAGRRGLEVTVQAVKSYEKRIGLYPYNELDLVETPTTAGGIEYPGLIVVAEDLYKDNAPFQEGATAHEAAHQWWYSLVGNDQVDEPWLDEALAQFTTALYYQDVYGPSGYTGDVTQDLLKRYLRVKGTEDDKRGDLPVAAYSGLQYGAIVYGKAALFFDAVRQQIGDDKTNAWMQAYFNAHRYGIVHEADLLQAIETQLDAKTVEQLMETWIRSPK